MFKVKHTVNGNIETVYDVRHNREESRNSFSGYHDDVQFLIYSKEEYSDRYEWIYVDASCYEPHNEEEAFVKEFIEEVKRTGAINLDKI